jgi:hypothetical protein
VIGARVRLLEHALGSLNVICARAGYERSHVSREVSSSCQGVKGVAMAILVCYWHDYDCMTIAYGLKSWRKYVGR